jgi:hypothetical protein
MKKSFIVTELGEVNGVKQQCVDGGAGVEIQLDHGGYLSFSISVPPSPPLFVPLFVQFSAHFFSACFNFKSTPRYCHY